MKRTGLLCTLLVTALAGCGGLQEMWEGPGAESFHPASIAVLPPITGPLEGSREPVHEVVTNALKRSKRYAQVIEPDQVNGVVAQSGEFRQTLTTYLSGLETVGDSDKDAAAKLGQALKADALLVVKVNAWEFGRAEGDKFGKVSLGFRLIDTKKGMIVWKARHEEIRNYMFFKPSLKDVAADLSDDMVKYMPH